MVKSNKRVIGYLWFPMIVLFLLASCTSDDGLETLTATGSSFTQSLFASYKQLSEQALQLPLSDQEIEPSGFFDSLFSAEGAGTEVNERLSEAFAAKARQAAIGNEPTVEDGKDANSEHLRARLVRAIVERKDRFPEQAARAQVDYDCWLVYRSTPGGRAASETCKTALDKSLPELEAAAAPAPAPPTAGTLDLAPKTQPLSVSSVPAPAFNVYFDFDSWTLRAEQLAVLTEVIGVARTGGQTRINVVGHTDTSGSSDYNQRLSVHRANVALEALVGLGANRAALHASGVGETDLAVPTPDGVKEAQNRRTVISLQP